MRAIRLKVPSFSLYGERGEVGRSVGAVHVEDIQSRSRKYLWQIAAHRHTDLSQCLLVTAGPASVVLEESRNHFEGPALIVIPAGTIHSFRFRAETLGYVLTISLARLTAFTAAAHQAPIDELFSAPRAVELADKPALLGRAAQLLECLGDELRQSAGNSEAVASWLACCVLHTAAGAFRHSNSAEACCGTDFERLRRFRMLIEARYAEHWPIERFANELGVSETSLNRLCRRLTGCTGFDLLQQRLVLEARRRLIYAPDSVSGVASALGFKDSAYFSRFFRRHAGVSPHEFRRQKSGG